MRTAQRYWLWVIIIVAVVLRLGVAFYMGDTTAILSGGVYDQVSYDALARRVLTGHGFSFGLPWWPMTAANAPTAHWSFLYTLYLAGVYAVFGFHPLTARVIQAVLAGVLMPWLTYRLGRRAFGPTVGLVAAAISAIYVYFFYFAAALMTETFFILGILWTLDLAGELSTSANRRLRTWALLGVAMGLTVLLRQTFLPVIGLIGLWLWYATPGRRARTVGGFALSVGIVVLSILPWTVRNYLVFDQLVLLNTNAGYAFFWANHPIHGTNFMALLPSDISYQSLIPPELRGLDEAALEGALWQRGLQFVLDDPARYLLLSLNRLKDQFMFWPTSGSGLISNLSRVGSFGVFLPFMIYGTWLAVVKSQTPNPKPQTSGKRSRLSLVGDWLRTPVALWLGFFVLYTGMHLASWAGIRYRLPTDAVMVIFAGLALTRLGEWAWRWIGQALARKQAGGKPV